MKFPADSIILIGMPGAGKSTAGVLAARAMAMSFVDTDILIQERAGRTLHDIIRDEGMDCFLRMEERAVLSLDVRHAVIATGGSVVYSRPAMEHLSALGTILYLHATPSALERRIKNITTRGIVMAPGVTLNDLYRERDALYRRYAGHVLDCTAWDLEMTVREILDAARHPSGHGQKET